MNRTTPLVALAVVVAVLTGCATGGTATDVFTLSTGDCILDTVELEVSQVPTVPCSEPHDYEVFAEFTLEGDSYPDDVMEQADELCIGAFDSFVGMSYDDSIYGVNHYTPTRESWSNGDRAVDCIIYLFDEKITGTLAGAKR